MIVIRVEQPGDTDDLRLLLDDISQSLRKVYQPTRAGLANKSRISGDLKRFVASLESRVVGTTQYYTKNQIMYVTALGVHTQYRRQGIARALIDRLMELAEQQSCLALRLSTIEETGNIPVFEKLGFVVVGEHADNLCESVKGEKVTDVEMERRVLPSLHI